MSEDLTKAEILDYTHKSKAIYIKLAYKVNSDCNTYNLCFLRFLPSMLKSFMVLLIYTRHIIEGLEMSEMHISNVWSQHKLCDL